jgi:putative membrane protein
MRYWYLSFSAIFIFAFLTLVQFKMANRKESDHHCHDGTCCHHHHENTSEWKKILNYIVFIFPIASALLLPIATLDSELVKAKGFRIPGLETKSEDPFVQRQILRPDTSIYYGKDGYHDLMQKELEVFSKKDQIILQDNNYLKALETIYQFPGQFSDKPIEFEGFVYHDETATKRQLFVLRFGIIHCVADSGVYGLLTEFPETPNIENDEWIHVKGRLSTIYYQPFNVTIPYVKVEEWRKIKEPKEPYVFRGYN